MLNTLIIGASGYTGAELVKLVNKHPRLHLMGLYVSEQSEDAGKPISQLYGQLKGVVDLPLLPLTNPEKIAQDADIVLLATGHEVSHHLAPTFIEQGCIVFDLSGAFRLPNKEQYTNYYGFEHQHSEWLSKAVYGLAEWNSEHIKNTSLVAVAGCYPTAAQLALKPLLEANLLDTGYWPNINAVSGVSGAGRKASMTNSFCEVSLQAYGIFEHRHQPEIAHHLGCEVIFTPHLANFKRGILATITAKLSETTSEEHINNVMEEAYAKHELVRLLGKQPASIQNVVNTNFCDIGWKVQGQHIVLTSAIDNLLKGASSQAIQCINIRFGFPQMTALL